MEMLGEGWRDQGKIDEKLLLDVLFFSCFEQIFGVIKGLSINLWHFCFLRLHLLFFHPS